MEQKIDTLHNYTMVSAIQRELSHVFEDANSLLEFVTDGRDSMAIDVENAIMITRVIGELIINTRKWKSSLLDRLENCHGDSSNR